MEITIRYHLISAIVQTIKNNAEKNKASVQNISVTIWNKINRTLNPLMENIKNWYVCGLKAKVSIVC